MNKAIKLSFLLLTLASSSIFAAGMGLGQTRIVFEQKNNKASIDIVNTDDRSYLVQSYIRGKQENPFEVIPPLARVEKNSRFIIKIIAKANSLPNDRETIFYFYSKSIPASSKKSGEATTTLDADMVVALENRIKLFYRPDNLPTDVKSSRESLKFKATSQGIQAINNSPYYVTMDILIANGKAIKMNVDKEETMIPPFSAKDYITSTGKGDVIWYAINDYGGTEKYNGKIQ